MSRSLLIALSLALVWCWSNPAHAAAPTTAAGATIAAEASSIALTAARAISKKVVSKKKIKQRKRYTKRATAPRKRKFAHTKRRMKNSATTVADRAIQRKCKSRKRSRRACRTHYAPLDEAYRPPEREYMAPRTALAHAPAEPIIDKPTIEPDPAPSASTDIVEQENDVPLIVQIALTLTGQTKEQALTLIETRDRETGQLSYRIVPGDESKRTPDEAELPDVILAGNERIVADIHSHPRVKPRGPSLQDKAFANRATQMNRYPGLEDFAAVERREAVSAILNPDGTVFLLRRIAGTPSVRVVEGAALPPLDEMQAHRLDLEYLYGQGYLAGGQWARPPIAQTARITP